MENLSKYVEDMKGIYKFDIIPVDSPEKAVIGMDIEVSIRRFLTQLPVHYKVASGNSKFCGVIISIDANSGKARSISRFQLP